MQSSLQSSRATAGDPFRDTSARWVVEGGPLAGTVLDVHVRADGSVEWRFAAGPAQGRVGRARTFSHQPVREGLAAVWFALGTDAVSATVDLVSRRFTGFVTDGTRAVAVSGDIHPL